MGASTVLGSIFFSPAAAAAFFATGMISLAPNVLLLLMPRYAAGGGGREASAWLSIGQAVGAGGLMADVFLHTLADEASSKNEASGIFVLMGFVIFFAVDLLVRAVNDTSSSHTHSHDNNTHSDHTTTHENGGKNVSTAETTTKRSIVLLNLTADALHNFTDGLAIGASYSMVDSSSSSATVWSLLASHSRGGFATLSIFFHEVPHELSDFCTLIRAGYSTRQAIMAQLFTAVAAFAGTATAIVVSEEAWAEERLLWVTAGGFLYLAATTILPDVLAEGGGGDGENSTATSRRLFRLAQLAAFCAGISCLYMVDVFGGDHYHHSHQGHNDDHNHNHGHHDHHHEATVGSIHEQHAEL